MLQYSIQQLASVIAIPIVTVLLCWTVVIFHKNRKLWGSYDIPIIALLILSIIRNMTIIIYILTSALNQSILIDFDYCSAIVWLFNSIHTFQASCLSTLAVIGLFSVKLYRKNQNLRQFLTPTHIVYHLFCLVTLCACVGVAAILANHESISNSEPCKFMPYELDIKFNVFVIVLNIFLASVSLISFIIIIYNYCALNDHQNGGFDYIKKSSSDLSDFSGGDLSNNKNYYDTYTIHRVDHFYNNQNHQNQLGIYCNNRDAIWNCDLSNISTTVSSTNSRKPCIATNQSRDAEENRTGLETIHPILIVCYLFYHLPIIILCIYPNLVAPWPVSGVALWLGLVQDILIPIGLSLVDSRFTKWVSNVYKCSNKSNEKLPHVGLDGKFRPFNSQPQSLEIHHQNHNVRALQQNRFPLTNGSLYTSIDGRLPVIHNYRRNKEQRGLRSNQKINEDKLFACGNCEHDLSPSHSNLHHLSPVQASSQLNLMHKMHDEDFRIVPKTRLVAKNSIRDKPEIEQSHYYSSSDEDYLTDVRNFDSLSSQSSYSITTEANCDFEFYQNLTKMSRSNSKRLFENFRLFVDNNPTKGKLQKSNSYTSLEDRRKVRKLLRSGSKLSDCTHNYKKKIKSVEYLPTSNASTVFIEDTFYFNYPNYREKSGNVRNYIGSVPDLKKIFISEYI